MQANVVVKRMPYVIVPSPAKRTNLFRSVTSCKKLQEKSEIFMTVIMDATRGCGAEKLWTKRLLEFSQQQFTCFYRWQKMYRVPRFFPRNLQIVWANHYNCWMMNRQGKPARGMQAGRRANIDSSTWLLCNPNNVFSIQVETNANQANWLKRSPCSLLKLHQNWL